MQVLTGPFTTLTAVELHDDVDPGVQCVVYCKAFIYVGLRLLLANMTGGPPSPRREWRKVQLPEMAARPGLLCSFLVQLRSKLS
jgi:hypothetical protein